MGLSQEDFADKADIHRTDVNAFSNSIVDIGDDSNIIYLPEA